jgi:DMSO/TMAO reductase YedYZ molybdopterin-dependent catalytic subunit
MTSRELGKRYETGVWAVPLALLPAFALSAAFGQASAVEPLVELIFAYTPLSLAHLLLTLLGPLARPVALFGAVGLTLPVGGLLGLCAPPLFVTISSRQRTFRWLVVGLGTLGSGLLLAMRANTLISAMSALLASFLFVPMVLWIRGRHRPRPAVAGRRKALRTLAGAPLVVGSLVALSSYAFWSTMAVRAFGLGDQVRQLFPFRVPGARKTGFPILGEEPEVSPVPQFYINSKNVTEPAQLAENWSLQITGLVRNPLVLSFEQLLGMPRTDLYATMRCVDNPVDGHLMSTALWSGVLIAEVLKLAQPLPVAETLVFHALDDFDEPLPLAALSPDSSLLVYAMNGATLTQSHGAPVRGLLPGWYGFRNVKWLQSIELQAAPTGGYWEKNGWTAEKIHPVARIDVARIVDSQHVLVAGVAFGGLQGVSGVEVQLDGGTWLPAELHTPALSPFTWVQWRVLVTTSALRFKITARMLDRLGQFQDGQTHQVYPAGSSGLHTIEVQR